MTESKLPKAITETVSVKKELLDGLLAKLDQYSRDIEMLKEVADKSRVVNWQNKHSDVTAKTVKLSTHNGKVVMAWRSLQDEVYADAQGRWHEKQTVEIITEDNQKAQLEYLHFAKLPKIMAEIVSQYTTPEGIQMMRLNLDGRQVDIDIKFVN